jgi:poly(3-hydroxybutyrate) depolymerase
LEFDAMNRSMRASGLAVVLAIACCACPALSDSIGINGVARTFTAQLPDKKPAPLVIVLHGNTQTGADMASRTSWPGIARREHFGVVWSTAKTLDFWRRANGCETQDANAINLDDRDRTDQTTVTRIESRCPPGRDVVLYRINNGGHRMPGAFPDARFPRMVNAFLGGQNRDIDGAVTIWGFFRKFR